MLAAQNTGDTETNDLLNSIGFEKAAVVHRAAAQPGRPASAWPRHAGSATRSTRAGNVVQLVRTLPCHGRGREFESRRPRHLVPMAYKQSPEAAWYT